MRVPEEEADRFELTAPFRAVKGELNIGTSLLLSGLVRLAVVFLTWKLCMGNNYGTGFIGFGWWIMRIVENGVARIEGSLVRSIQMEKKH